MAKKEMSLVASGFDELNEGFKKLITNSEGTMKKCVYDGAGVVADEMKKRVKSLKTNSSGNKGKRYPYEYEKNVLVDNLGIAKISSKNSINTKVGFDGYYKNKSGNDRPVQLLANGINAGTSFLKKQPFINQTTNSAKNKCIEAMQKQLDKSIKEQI